MAHGLYHFSSYPNIYDYTAMTTNNIIEKGQSFLAYSATLILSQLQLLRSSTDKRQQTAITAAATIVGTWTLYRLLFSKRRRQIENIVPLASGSLPIVGHALAINRDPQKFLAECREKYGTAFRLNLAGRETFVLTGRLIPELLFASRKQFSFTEGVEVVVPTQRVLHLSYDHKHKEEEISPRDKHPSMYLATMNFMHSHIYLPFLCLQLSSLSSKISNQSKLACFLNVSKRRFWAC